MGRPGSGWGDARGGGNGCKRDSKKGSKDKRGQGWELRRKVMTS